jgi:hypothetical protein
MSNKATANILEEYYEETEEYKYKNEEEYGDEVAPREIIEKKVSNFKVQPSSQVKPSYKEVLKAVVALLDQMNSDELAFAYKPEY